jgi:Na+-translocating ferredoxin:NAD+ oxidoreductase RnfC subunit
VNRIANLVDQGKLKEAATLNAKQCIGCASCSYSCLAGRNLAAKVKLAKDYIA